MKYGVSKLGTIPVRKEPNHRSEMVNQLLFADVYEVLKVEKDWLYIKTLHDHYEGWIDINQHTNYYLDNKVASLGASVALDLLCIANSQSDSIPITAGSTLPEFDGLNFKLGKEKWVYNGQAIKPEPMKNAAIIEKICLKFLHTPYLWGGRTALGMDCSGFSQVVFKFMGVSLLRDAYQQAEQGTMLNFPEETLPGDLAFFGNDEGKIIHVGIILKDQRIIHSSGKVRIDKLDHFGIYNADVKKYSHQLKALKRVL